MIAQPNSAGSKRSWSALWACFSTRGSKHGSAVSLPRQNSIPVDARQPPASPGIPCSSSSCSSLTPCTSSGWEPSEPSSPTAATTASDEAASEPELPDMATLTVPELVRWIANCKAGEHASSGGAGAAAAAAAAVELAERRAYSSAGCQHGLKDLQAGFGNCPGAFKGAVVLLNANSSDASVQKAAANIIHHAVYLHPSNASGFLGCEEALDSLAKLLSSSDAGRRAAAVWSLCGLSTAGSTTRATIAAHAGILRCLPLLLVDPSEDVSRRTSVLVYQLASRQPVHQSLLGKADIVIPLAKLLGSTDSTVQNSAARALRILAAGAETKAIIGGQTDAIQQLIAAALGGNTVYLMPALRAIVHGHPMNAQVLLTACTLEEMVRAVCGAGASASPAAAQQSAAAVVLLLLLETDRTLVATLVQQMTASPKILEVLVGMVDTAGWCGRASAAADILQLVGDSAAMGPSNLQAASTLINSSSSKACSAAAGLVRQNA